MEVSRAVGEVCGAVGRPAHSQRATKTGPTEGESQVRAVKDFDNLDKAMPSAANPPSTGLLSRRRAIRACDRGDSGEICRFPGQFAPRRTAGRLLTASCPQ